VADYVRRLREIVGGEELLQVPSVSVALRDGKGRVLLGRHSEGNVRLTALVGVFGGPKFVVLYRNGHRTS
jgi:hypothetical protein